MAQPVDDRRQDSALEWGDQVQVAGLRLTTQGLRGHGPIEDPGHLAHGRLIAATCT